MANVNPLEQALIAEGVSEDVAALARSIQHQESSGNKNTKTSNAGAVGNMQIIPSTFNSVADKGWDINDPVHNARAGIRYLKQGYDKAKGDPGLAAAWYYGGPSGMEKAAKGIAVSDPLNPKAPNTLQYAQQVTSRLSNGAGKSNVPMGNPVATLSPVGLEDGVPDAMPVEVPSEVLAQGMPMPQQYVIPQGPDPWAAFQKALPRKGGRPVVEAKREEFFAPKDWSVFQTMFGKPTKNKIDFNAFSAWGKKRA